MRFDRKTAARPQGRGDHARPADHANSVDPAGGGEAGRTARANIYDEVTQRVCAELAEGRVPWVQPWGTNGTGSACLPRNAVTARPYSGINILLLWGAAQEAGYPSQGWLTFRQALAAGGCVRKGERGTGVVYADRFIPKTRPERLPQAGSRRDEKARASEAGEDARSVAFLKRFTVFNVAQCEGLPETIAGDPAPLPEREIVPVGEDLIASSGVAFRIGGAEAFYAPGADYVQVPPMEAFFASIDWYRTAFHELSHSTGHSSRLARQLLNPFGSKDYAREELVAEMGAAFLCASLGIQPTVRHADYIGAWLEVCQEDNRAVFRAASAASKAADWLLARRAGAGCAGAGQGDPAEREVHGEGAITLTGEDAA